MALQSLERLKSEANALYARGKVSAAAELYTSALCEGNYGASPELQGVCSLLLSNRAICHRYQNAWPAVGADALAAVRLDPSNFRANFLLGEALSHARAFRASVARFERALSLAQRGKKSAALIAETEAALATARAEWFEAARARDAHTDAELAHALGRALCVHHGVAASGRGGGDWALPAIREGGGAPVPRYEAGRLRVEPSAEEEAALAAATAGTPAAAAGAGTQALAASLPQQLRALDAVFEARAAQRQGGAVPDWAQCPVSLELMLDPVVTPSGASFERAAIEACLRTKAEDPLTRAPLTAAELIPNLGLRTAIAAFLAENPWAHPKARQP